MATKSLTHIFLIMRDKSFQQKNLYHWEENCGDQDALVVRDRSSSCARLPEWTNMAEEVRYHIISLQQKTKNLFTLQNKLVRQPSLDDNNPEEMQLSALANDITKLLERCRGLVLQLSRVPCTGREENLKSSVVKALMFTLTGLNTCYSSSCSAYSQSMQNLKHTSTTTEGPSLFDDDDDPHQEYTGVSEEQLLFLASNQTAVIADREKMVKGILQSTLHLNQIFRDVAHLVHEQGTLVDRIDCNIETASVKVQEGRQQLSKASQHQKNSKNLKCIVLLAATIIILVLTLVFVKS